jgi:hypothetical protein
MASIGQSQIPPNFLLKNLPSGFLVLIENWLKIPGNKLIIFAHQYLQYNV